MQKLYAETDLEKTLFAMGAIFIEENHVLEHLSDQLGGEGNSVTEEESFEEVRESFFRLDLNLDPYLRADCIGFLEELWDVVDVISAKKALDELRNQGHRTKFDALKRHTDSLHRFKEIFKFDFADPAQIQMTDEQFETLSQWVMRADGFVPKVGILGWDAARYVHLVRLCFVANYVRADEAWASLQAFAPLVQNRFSSWNEFSQSFLIGRTFWAGEEDPELKSACERLLGFNLSPWRFCRP